MPTDFDRVRFDASGYAIIPAVLSAAEVFELTSSLIVAGEGDTARRRGEVYAIRNLLDAAPDIRKLCDRPAVRRLAENALGPECFPVQATLLDKISEANWKVPWHQDLYIPVKQQIDVSGFCGWSEKAGVVHVKPPAEILDATVGIRLHLDECGEANGPLRVIPGSHRGGELNSDAIRDCEKKTAPVICVVPLGGALLLKPLLLHASSPSQTPAHRRVIHLLFASGKLPGGLEWHRAT